MVCPIFIGRQFDLTTMLQLIEGLQHGLEHMFLLAGEAGIGKSRLVAEAKTYAAAHDVRIFQGDCFQTERSVPYAPLLDLFQSYFMQRTPAPLADNVKPLLTELYRLLPDLPLRFPELASQPISRSADPEEEKRCLFATMTYFFTEQAMQQPVLLVVEDVHWCDDLSLEFLLHLARRSQQMPLLLLVTYRSDELHPRLRQWLSQVDRERLAQEYALERFSRDDVAAMLYAMLEPKQEVDADLLDTLYSRSEGNPFFVEELLKSLLTTGELVYVDGIWKRTALRAPVPRSVQEAVQQRIMYLSADAKHLVTLAAVAGRRFNITLLQEVMRCDEAHLLALLKELIVAQLVVEEAVDQFAFRHALTQQAIADELLLRERQALHRHLAQTLERLCPTSPTARECYLEDLAYHSYEAGMWEQALAYAQEAGAKALTLYAQQAAIDHFTRAEEATHHLSQTPPVHLSLERGQAYETLGDFEGARADYEQALDTARTVQDRLMEWQSMLALGFLWTGHDYERAGVWFRQALALSEELAEPTLHARSLNRLGNWLLNTGQIQEALEAHQEALRLFEVQADRQGMAEALEMLGGASFFLGDPARAAQEFFGRVIELFRSLGDQQRLSSALAVRALDAAPETIESTFSALRTREECVQDIEEALRLARQTNSLSGQAFVEMATTNVLSSFGDYGSALAHAHEALRIATSIEHQEWIAATNGALGQLYLLLLDPDRAITCLEAGIAGAQASRSMIWVGYLTPYLALASLLRRDFPRAAAALETILPRDQKPGTFFERQVARVWGELALAQGEAARALTIAGQLLVSAPGDAGPQPIPHLLALKGEALLALGRLEEAAAAFEEAKRGAELRQAPSILWRIQRSLGRVYHVLQREDQAQQEWAAARYLIQKLASTIDDPSLRERFFHTALALVPKEKPPRSREVARQAFGGLTPREREVATLVAQGKTSRQIADLLVVSERTAEVHVSNILGKLGFTSRTQIATWAVETGLAKR
ncbi:MAG TPA: AAA family ATPase [Ktedonobacterales bacterium]|nr:AAA family ATPase [Ktedonobacterales bacterium]